MQMQSGWLSNSVVATAFVTLPHADVNGFLYVTITDCVWHVCFFLLCIPLSECIRNELFHIALISRCTLSSQVSRPQSCTMVRRWTSWHEATGRPSSLHQCIRDIGSWCTSRRLQLNATRTFGFSPNARQDCWLRSNCWTSFFLQPFIPCIYTVNWKWKLEYL